MSEPTPFYLTGKRVCPACAGDVSGDKCTSCKRTGLEWHDEITDDAAQASVKDSLTVAEDFIYFIDNALEALDDGDTNAAAAVLRTMKKALLNEKETI